MVSSKIGVPGFDEILGSELSPGSCILLQGGPGSGKTTFCMRFLHEGATRFDEPGLYVTLCENPDEIRRNMLQYKMDFGRLEKENKFSFLDVRPVRLTPEGYIVPNEALFKGETIPFSHISCLIRDRVQQMGAKRLVLDSLTVLTGQYENQAYVGRAFWDSYSRSQAWSAPRSSSPRATRHLQIGSTSKAGRWSQRSSSYTIRGGTPSWLGRYRY